MIVTVEYENKTYYFGLNPCFGGSWVMIELDQ